MKEICHAPCMKVTHSEDEIQLDSLVCVGCTQSIFRKNCHWLLPVGYDMVTSHLFAESSVCFVLCFWLVTAVADSDPCAINNKPIVYPTVAAVSTDRARLEKEKTAAHQAHLKDKAIVKVRDPEEIRTSIQKMIATEVAQGSNWLGTISHLQLVIHS